MACYAFAPASMLALGRTTPHVPGSNIGLISRYVLVAAPATIALVVLTTLHRPQWSQRYLAVAVVAVSLVTDAIGGGKADEVRRSYAPLSLSAIALRVDAPTALEALLPLTAEQTTAAPADATAWHAVRGGRLYRLS